MVSALSPLRLPWATLKLAGRFVLPLTMWFALGYLLRYLLLYGGYKVALTKSVGSVAPVTTLSLLVLVKLCIGVAMIHSVREGLSTVTAREEDGELAPWAVGNDESMLAALSRALLPFMIFYLAWGWYSDDAEDFVSTAESRGFAEQGLGGQLRGQHLILDLADHLYVAVGLTVGFFAAKLLVDWFLSDRIPQVAGITMAFCEVNWALFGVFTVDELRGRLTDWLAARQAWAWVADTVGDTLELWPVFKFAVLGSLVWLVIAGVVLGVDARDEQIVFGSSRAARRLVRVSGADRERSPREILTRELRDRWLPTWYGLRLVRRAGILPFAAFAFLFMGLDTAEVYVRREIYELLGPHSIAYWVPRLHVIDFLVGLVHEVLRICLLAAAFDLVMARVIARTGAKPAVPSDLPLTSAPPA